MAGETLGTDLFGDPVLARREGPGRPEVVWNKATSDRVLLAFARGWSVKRAAVLVGLSGPTLRKVYFSECAKRLTALDRFEMTQLVRLNDQAAAGNVSAERELARRLDQLRMRDAASRFDTPERKAKAPKPKKGLKDQRRDEAWDAGRGDDDWGPLLHGETGSSLPN